MSDPNKMVKASIRDHLSRVVAVKESILRHLTPDGLSDEEAAQCLKEHSVMFWEGPDTPEGVEHLTGFGEHLGDFVTSHTDGNISTGFRPYSDRLEGLEL